MLAVYGTGAAGGDTLAINHQQISLVPADVSEFLLHLISSTGLELSVFLGLCGVSYLASMIAASVGLGGGVLLLGALSVVLPPAVLIPVHGVAQLGSNLGRASLMIGRAEVRFLAVFVVGTLAGSVIGANLFVALPVWLLQFALALFVLYATWAPGFQARRPSRPAFFGVGLVSGFATLFIGGSAPLVAPFVRAGTADRRQFVATLALLMAVQHGVKIAAFGFIGFAFGAYTPLLVGLVGFGFAGTLTGRLLLDRLPERVFAVGLRVVLTLLAARLLYAAFRDLTG